MCNYVIVFYYLFIVNIFSLHCSSFDIVTIDLKVTLFFFGRSLLKYGADASIADDRGNTPFMLAQAGDKDAIVNLFIEAVERAASKPASH